MGAVTNWAELHRRVAFGQAGGRILWQPRIGCWFTDKVFAGETLPPPFERFRLPANYHSLSMPDQDAALYELTTSALPAIFRELDCSARIYYYNTAFRRVEDPSVRVTTRMLNATDQETAWDTPAGRQTAVVRRTPSTFAREHVKRPIETEADMKVAIWREEHATWAWDQAEFDKVRGLWGNLGAPTMYMPRMNVQSLYVESMGTEKGILALCDWPDTVEAFFRAKEACHDRLIELINRSPVDIVNFGENVHAGTLSPDLFETYHLPACRRRCERLHQAGKFVSSHWDGDTRPLLRYARQTGLDGLEAVTPKPQGDVTLEEIKEGLGDTMFLLDGIPAILFDSTYPVSLLEETTHRLIELFAPRLILGISDEISSTGDLARVRLVGDIVRRYNARCGTQGPVRGSPSSSARR